MERIVHELIQGSPEWHQFRLDHDGASEAAPMLGLSKNVTRSELLRVKHTGIAKEFSDFVQERILDHGHEVEALARPIVEELIGEELYPATYSYGRLSASCDGLTMDGLIAFEHKQWARELAASVARGELPDEHQPQCQQVLLVTGAEQLIFAVSDGTPEHFESMQVLPDKAWQDRIIAGWAQFHEDLKTYTPPEVIPAAVAAPIKALPTVLIKVEGSVALVSNLDKFGELLREFVARIPEKPETDQQFADCKASISALQDAQDALDAAEAHALGQVASFDEMKRTKAVLWELARTTRLAVEKLVVRREREVKENIVAGGKAAYDAHVESLKAETEGMWIVIPAPDFATAIKNKRTIASLQNAVDTALANGKIAADASAKLIRANLACLKTDSADYEFLFNDRLALIGKPIDDLRILIKARIDAHKAAEAKRLDDIRIAAEAKARADLEAANKAEAEKARLAEVARIEQERLASIPQPVPEQPKAAATQELQPAYEGAEMSRRHSTPAPAAAPTIIANPQTEVGVLRTLIADYTADMTAPELERVVMAIDTILATRKQRAA
jgi:predicted phage-related endonuclease